jgi:hypothetical protein
VDDPESGPRFGADGLHVPLRLDDPVWEREREGERECARESDTHTHPQYIYTYIYIHTHTHTHRYILLILFMCIVNEIIYLFIYLLSIKDEMEQ